MKSSFSLPINVDSQPAAVRASNHWARLLKKRLFGISSSEVLVLRRGFVVEDPVKQERIEAIGSYFLAGYHAALECDTPEQLFPSLDQIPLEYQGFAYEGAAMAIGLLERCLPWRGQPFAEYLQSPENLYPYLSHVGLGWALAHIPGAMNRFCRKCMVVSRAEEAGSSRDSLLSCLAIDGFGFHQSYFDWHAYVQSQRLPASLPKPCLPLFTQGVGRSLSFVFGMDVQRIATTIQQFPLHRQGDLWSGVGLAAAYAGGLVAPEMDQLKRQARLHLPALAQGIAFAAKARQRAGHIPDHTTLACQIVWQLPPQAVAMLTDTTLNDLPLTSPLSAYAEWRERIQRVFASSLAELP